MFLFENEMKIVLDSIFLASSGIIAVENELAYSLPYLIFYFRNPRIAFGSTGIL